MELRKVNPNTIKVPEVRVTARFDADTWQLFQDTVKTAGIITPVICCEVEGELMLVDGLHRVVTAINNKQDVIDVAVIPGDMIDVLTKNIFLDHLRGKTPPSEMVKVIETLWKEYGLDSEKISARTGIPRDYVEKLQAVSELTPLCREALDEERIKVGHAFALTKLKDPVRQEAVLYQLEMYHWSVKDLEEYIKSVLALITPPGGVPPGAPVRLPVKVKCAYCKGEFDPSEVACPITCRECSAILLTAMVQARRETQTDQSHDKGQSAA
jgi:ParB-like chromosome segregation protein Spo0J